MNTVRSFRIVAVALLLLGAVGEHLPAQEDFGSRLGVSRGGEVFYDPMGPGVRFDARDPAVKKWYVPQELFNEYQWRQQDYTNYARDRYHRYQNINLEGDYFYDQFGRFLNKGWIVYDWRQMQPTSSEGSSVFKNSPYSSWFSKLVISADNKGQHHFSVMGTLI